MSSPRLFLVIALTVGASAAAGCSDPPEQNPDARNGVCGDLLDNDGDGSTDYPADPGCDSLADNDETNDPVAACNDGRDNDNDTLTDYPNDPGCYNPLQNTETDDCPSGPTCPDCANGVDDDADGMVDFPEDPGCGAASGDEFTLNPNACGPNLMVQLFPGAVASGVLPATPSNLASSECGGAAGEVPFQVSVTEPSVLVATTDLPGTSVDTVIYLRTDCVDVATELACNNDTGLPGVTASRITAIVAPGTYYLVVDGSSGGVGGMFQLQVELLNGEGQPCASQADCGPGLQCRIPEGSTEMVCAQPVCNDTDDADGDGLDAYPDDPGCESPVDFDELDECPDGPTCPACANGEDDDGDGQIDYPADVDCSAASHPVEGCTVETDPILVATSATVTGSTSGAADNFFPNCSFSFGDPDRVVLITLPAMQSFHVDDSGSSFSAILALHDQTCENELACDVQFTIGGQSIDAPDLPAGSYAVIVDGNFGSSGSFNLNFAGDIAPGGACDGELAMAGVIGCPTGYACTGGICLGNLECNNGLDDDGDGDGADYPADPGCTGPLDTTEADDCPNGPECPQCANNDDDDNDSEIDYPNDPDCNAASDNDEFPPACTQEIDPIEPFLGASVSGTTVGASDNFSPGCAFSFAPDVVATMDLPQMESLVVDLNGTNFDSVLTVFDPSCTIELGCSDFGGFGGETIFFDALAAGTYSVVIDGWNTNQGTYTANINGVIAPLGACDGPLAGSGALVCPAGYACTGGICLGTAECNNGVDDDGDGDPGYPSDPGCSDPLDDTEADNCPSGAGCPQCGNNLDDDSDGLTDYPNDPSCVAASVNNEGLCGASETSPITPIVIPLYAGTTIGGNDDFVPTCGFDSGSQDRTYSLTLPVPVQTLTANTFGSSLDTVLSITNAACTSLACNDQSGIGGTSLVTLANQPAGSYGIVVDGWFSDGSYQLEVRATAMPGAACNSPLFNTGVLSCPPNHICTAGTCQPL